MKARKASKTKSRIAMLLYGKQGTGKSTLALQLSYLKKPDGSPLRVLFLDCECSSVDDYLGDLEADGIDLDNIYIVYTLSLSEIQQCIKKVMNNENFYEIDEETGEETDEIVLDADGKPFRADAIVVDGTTVLNETTKQGLIQFSRKRNKVKADKENLIGDERVVKIEGAGLELKDYNVVKSRGQSLILDLMATGVHFIVTARETDEKVSVQDSDGKTSNITTGKKTAEGFKDMGYNVKTEMRLFRKDDDEDSMVYAKVIKDRTKVHKAGEIIEDPTTLDWQVVIDKTANNKEFILGNDLDHATKIEEELYSKEVLAKAGEAITDQPTTSSDQKTADQLRAEINAHIKTLSTPNKAAMKNKLKEQDLPIAFKNIKDVEVLQKVLNTIKA